MAQSVTERERAPASPSAADVQRDDEAWNLPRLSVKTGEQATVRDRLDWEGFVEARFPGTRRHNLEAIVSYGAYRRSGPVDSQKSRLR